MEKCFACKKRIWFWQRTGPNTSWHKDCSNVWEQGYNTAMDFCAKECMIHHFPTPTQLYGRRGSIGELLPKELWRNQE